MSKFKTVEFRICPCGAGRGYSDVRLAERALGRVWAKRDRRADLRGTRRGMQRENRVYTCDAGLHHLTEQSKRARTAVGL